MEIIFIIGVENTTGKRFHLIIPDNIVKNKIVKPSSKDIDFRVKEFLGHGEYQIVEKKIIIS